MRMVPAVVWELDGDPGGTVDARLMPLLRAVADSASLAAAVAQRGISYRAAWGLLRDYERRLGEPLVLLERGRGARLSPAGERLVGATEAATRRLARVLPTLAVDVGMEARRPMSATARTLRVAASHDLVLAALAGELSARHRLTLDLSFMGSLPALRAFDEGRADMAGFHVPIGERLRWDRTAMLQALQSRRDRVIRLVDREQGLMLAPGNARKVKSFSDVARERLRFINRQPGSGTRLLIDQMLRSAKLDRASIDGYGNEEFTHRAVAATVASGGADVGFGLRAAAAEHRLAFVPLLRERYYLAVRANAVRTAAVARLLEVLRSPLLARIARRFAGYRIEDAGAIAGVDAILSPTQD